MRGATPPVQCHLLGPVTVTVGEQRYEPPPRLWGLVTALAWHPGGLPRARLAAIVAPEGGEAAARRRLSRLLWLLREHVPALPIDAGQRHVALDAEVWTDVAEITAAVGGECLERVVAALDHVAGELAEGCDLPWVVERRDEVATTVRTLRTQLAAARLAEHQWVEALALAETLCADRPDDPGPVALRVRALLGLGERYEARATLAEWEHRAAGGGLDVPDELRTLAARVSAPSALRLASAPTRSAPVSRWLEFAASCGPRGDREGQRVAIARLREAVSEGALDRHALRVVEIDRALDDHALSLAARLLDLADDGDPSVQLRRARHALLSWQIDDALEAASSALVAAHAGGDEAERAAALLLLADAESRRAKGRDALACADEARRIGWQRGWLAVELSATVVMGRELVRQARAARARELLEPVAERAADAGLARVALEARGELARAACRGGRLVHAAQELQQLREEWAALGLVACEAAVENERAYALLRAGEVSRSQEVAEDAAALAERGGVPGQGAWAWLRRAAALVCADGATPESRAATAQAVERAERAGDASGRGAATTLEAFVAYLDRDCAWALSRLRVAHDLRAQREEHDDLMLVLAIEGLTHLALDDPDAALEATERGLRELARLGASDLGLPLVYAHARALEALERSEESRRWLRRGYEQLHVAAEDAGVEPHAIAARDPFTRALTAAAEAQALDDGPQAAWTGR